MVAILCVSKRSVYKQLDCDVYDTERDARTFPGDMPIVAHPPCRAWSAFYAHQAKPEPGEKELGLWCCEQLKVCGGVLEQPAHSRLFSAGGLPLPREPHGDLWSMAVDQSWWGDSRKKATWLCFSGISTMDIEVPFRLHEPRGDHRRWKLMSKTQRSATNLEMAIWLIDVASKARGNSYGRTS